MSASRAAAPGLADRLERLQGRAVVPLPVADERLGRALPEDVAPLRCAELAIVSPNSSRSRSSVPQRMRRLHARRRRDVLGDRLEQLADEAVGRVGHEADPAAGTGDARQLGRGPLLVRREHRAEHRAHDIERGVLERESLGVALDGSRPRAPRPRRADAPGRGARGRSRCRRPCSRGGRRRGRRCRCRSRRRARARSSGRRAPR